MKVLVEMDLLLYDCRVFVEMELPKGSTSSEIGHRKDIIEDRMIHGPGVASGSIVVERIEKQNSLRDSIKAALNELGVPQPGCPAPVAKAVEILQSAIS